jgi:hypothetical protein
MFSVYTNAARVEEQLRLIATQIGLGKYWQRIMASADERMKRYDFDERAVRAYEASRTLAFYIAWSRKWGTESMDKTIAMHPADKTIPDSEFEDFKAAGPWNGILRKIGFDAVTDEGVGYIHWHEESQTCFLSNHTFRNVYRIEVESDEYPKDTRELGSIANLMRLVKNDQIDPIETMYILQAMIMRTGTPVGYTNWSYRPGIRPTRGEARAIVDTLIAMHPHAMRAWGTLVMNSVMNDVFEYVEYPD